MFDTTTKVMPSLSNPIFDDVALKGIMECYIANPELVKTLYLNEEDMPCTAAGDYKWMLEILHVCSNKEYKEFTQDLVNRVIETHDTRYNPPVSATAREVRVERLKKKFQDLYEIVEQSGHSTKNADSHYSIVRKYITLNKLRDLGYDITPFYNPEAGGEKTKAAEYEFLSRSETEILDYYKTAAVTDTDDIKSQLKITSDLIPVDARDLPGADKTSIYLIGQESTDTDPRPYVEWMELGTFNSVIGAAKAGKTQLMMQMAFAIQNGFDLWGMPVMKKDVLYVDFELTAKQINKRMNCLRKYFTWKLGREITKENSQDMKYLSVSKSFGEGKVDIDAIIEACKAYKRKKGSDLGMIVFDCFYTFVEGDPNLEQDAKKTLQRLKSLVDDETTVCYVHHTNKAGFNDMGDVIYAAGGSGVHGKIVDSTYVVYPVFGGKSKELLNFRISTTGRSSCGGSINCQRDKGSYWLFDMIPEGNLDGDKHFDKLEVKSDETNPEKEFIKPEAEDDPDQENEVKECIEQARAEAAEQDEDNLENQYDPDDHVTKSRELG